MGSTSLLFVGDVHLGRRPGRGPAELVAGLGPRAAFEAVIERALEGDVRAVVFLGDVVDAEDHFLEAYSVLEDGVRRLGAAGIEVCAVAGNHDVRALPRLADELEGFRLLGRDGRWEEHLVADPDGAPLARLVAWSFPRRTFDGSPLPGLGELALEPRSDVPTIGLLHADLDQYASRYAPVARRDLVAVGAVDAWLLGHVHAPSHTALGESRPIGYLGSVVGLDPTETGVHGPWELVRGNGRAVHLRQLPLAPLAWAALDLSVEGLTEAAELDEAVLGTLRDFAAREGDGYGAARAVGCRLRLVGRTPLHRALATRVESMGVEELRLSHGERTYFVDRLVDRARPALDLPRLARGNDPPGLLAQKLLALEEGEEEAAALVARARERLGWMASRRPWSYLEAPPMKDGEVRELLRRAGERALDELLAQRGEDG